MQLAAARRASMLGLTGLAVAGVLALVGGGLAASWAGPRAGQAWALLCFAPIAEELVFRLGLQESLLRLPRLGPAAANVLTAFAFASAHVWLRGDATAGLVALPALLVGLLYQAQRRVGPCIALHVLMNGVWLLLPHPLAA